MKCKHRRQTAWAVYFALPGQGGRLPPEQCGCVCSTGEPSPDVYSHNLKFSTPLSRHRMAGHTWSPVMVLVFVSLLNVPWVPCPIPAQHLLFPFPVQTGVSASSQPALTEAAQEVQGVRKSWNTCGRNKVGSRCGRRAISSGSGKGDCVVWWGNPVRIWTLLRAVWALQPILTLSTSSLVMRQSHLCYSAEGIRSSYFVLFPRKQILLCLHSKEALFQGQPLCCSSILWDLNPKLLVPDKKLNSKSKIFR